MSVNSSVKSSVSAKLLKWYDLHKHDRAMPWRDVGNAYCTWLSEIMLQQTTVGTVKAYYNKFLQLWPTVEALAEADLEDIRAAWAGLGYYSRASNLHKCAQAVVAQHHGVFPRDQAQLQALPGIGPYTAAAIAAIAYGQPANVVDGNVERVMSRLHASHEGLRELAAQHVPQKRAGDYAQALMDLGAMVCTPKSPTCPLCPLKQQCQAFAAGNQAEFPRKKVKLQPKRYATAYIITNKAGEVWLRKRPEKGILAGLWEVPATPFVAKREAEWAEALLDGTPRQLTPLEAEVRHVFTHMDVRISLVKARFTPKGGRWVALHPEIPQDVPTLTRKILASFKEVLEKD